MVTDRQTGPGNRACLHVPASEFRIQWTDWLASPCKAFNTMTIDSERSGVLVEALRLPHHGSVTENPHN